MNKILLVILLATRLSAQSLEFTVPAGPDSNAWVVYSLAESLERVWTATRDDFFWTSNRAMPPRADYRAQGTLSFINSEVIWTVALRDDQKAINDKITARGDFPSELQSVNEKIVSEISKLLKRETNLKPILRWTKNPQVYEKVLRAKLGATRSMSAETVDRVFQSALRDEPKNGAVMEAWGDAAAAQRRWNDALKYYRQAITAEPTRFSAEEKIGDLHYSHLGLVKEAIFSFQQASEKRPNEAALYVKLGYAYYDQKEFAQAKGQSQKAISLASPQKEPRTFADAKNLSGLIAIAQKDTVGAKKFFEEALQYSRETSAARNLARLHEIQRRLNDAHILYERILKIVPQDAETHMAMANLLYERKKYTDAAIHYTQAVTQKPELESTRENPIQIMIWLEKSNRLSAVCDSLSDKLLDHDDDNARLTLAYAETYFLKRHSEAVNDWKILLARHPDWIRLSFYLGDAYFKLDQIEQAMKYYSEYSQYSQDGYSFAKGQLAMGKILIRQKRYEAAQDALLKSIRINPNAESYFYQGLALRGYQLNDEAIKSFERATNLFPNYAAAHCELGKTYLSQNNYKDAFHSLERAVALDSNDYNNVQALAQAYMTLERWDDAERVLRPFTLRYVTNPILFLDLGECFYQQGKLADAKAALTKSRLMDSSYARTDFRIACIFAMEQKNTEALEWLKKALDKKFVDFSDLAKERAFKSLRPTKDYQLLVTPFENAFRDELIRKLQK